MEETKKDLNEEKPEPSAAAEKKADDKTEQVKKAVSEEENAETKNVKNETPEENEQSWVKFDIHVPAKEVDAKIDELALEYASEVKLPGFRKGRVPSDVIKNRYRKIIVDEALNKVIEYFVGKKIREDDLKIAGQPVLENVDYEPGQDLKAKLKVEVFPEIKLPDLSALKVEVDKDKIKTEEFSEEDQVEMFLDRNRRRRLVDNRPIQEGDFVALTHQDMNLKTKKKSPKKPIYFMVKPDEKTEIPDLFKELLGKNLNDEFEFQRDYPTDYERKKWAGHTISHAVKIDQVYAMDKPEINEEFLKSMGLKEKSEFVAKLKEEFDKYQQRMREEVEIGAIIDALVDATPFIIPQGLVQQEMMHAIKQNPQLLQDVKEEGEDKFQNLKDSTEKNIRFSLILEEIKKAFDIKVNAEDMEKEYKKIAEQNKVPVKEVKKYYGTQEKKAQVREALLRDKALEVIKEKVTIS